MKMRSFGVEIECYVAANPDEVARKIQEAGVLCHSEHYNHETRDHWKITTDSSLMAPMGYYAMEIVSPILRYRDGAEQIKKVCAVINGIGAKVDKRCGLHVHHDVRHSKCTHIGRVLHFYALNENVIDQLVAPSRRGSSNQYCRELQSYLPRWSRRPRCWRDLEMSSRYHKVNTQSFVRYGTIEIRHHQGTTNATKIVDWVSFTQTIFSALRFADSPVYRFEDLSTLLTSFGSLLKSEVKHRLLSRAADLSVGTVEGSSSEFNPFDPDNLNPTVFRTSTYGETVRRSATRNPRTF